jgi:hypothetical protein
MSLVLFLLIVLRGANLPVNPGQIVYVQGFTTLQECESFKARVDARAGDRVICAAIPVNQ